MADDISGTAGYLEEAARLIAPYEAIPFENVHAAVLHLLPTGPGRVLDVGAGTGRDAARFAEMGHRVVAVEPTDGLREAAIRLHPSPAIDWVDDGLPELAQVVARKERFNLVMLTAVWMHLDAAERRTGMPVLADLLRPGGVMIMSLRHGPVPEGRRMFEVTAEETIDLAAANGLRALLQHQSDSLQAANRRAGVTWTHLAFSASKSIRSS